MAYVGFCGKKATYYSGTYETERAPNRCPLFFCVIKWQ
nr:MAG TPA: hypothetical protein [Caudoviricetes sp.]